MVGHAGDVPVHDVQGVEVGQAGDDLCWVEPHTVQGKLPSRPGELESW